MSAAGGEDVDDTGDACIARQTHAKSSRQQTYSLECDRDFFAGFKIEVCSFYGYTILRLICFAHIESCHLGAGERCVAAAFI